MSVAFAFPPNPALNEVVTLPDGTQAQWNGYAWVSVTDASGITYPLAVIEGGTGANAPLPAKRNLQIPNQVIDDAAPAAPVYGDRWIRPASMTEVVWVPNAGTDGTWVNLADAGSAAYPIPISRGGTGATTAAQARINLGITNADNQWLLADGVVAKPGLAFASELGLGWYRSAAGHINMAAGGGNLVDFDFDTTTDTRVSLYPQAVGRSGLEMTDSPVSAANSNGVGIGVAAVGPFITERLGGSAVSKPLGLSFSAGVNVSGNLVVQGANMTIGAGGSAAGIVLNAAAASGKDILARSNGVDRWYMRLGEGSPNNDFVLWSYDDAQTLHQIMRAPRTGATLNLTPTVIMEGDAYVTKSLYVGHNGTIGNSLGLGPGGGWWRVTKDTATVIRMYWNNDANHNWYYDISLGVYGFTTNNGNFILNNDGDTAQKKNAGGWAAISDARIKERIEDYTPGLEAILKLRPRVFSFRKATGYDTSERHVGMVSQEAKAGMPDTVSVKAGKLGDIELDDMQTFNPTNIQYAMVNAFKEINARLAALEAA